MDINSIPRVLVDSYSTNFNQFIFNLGFQSGQAATGFCLTPAGMKNLSETLAMQVQRYEQQFGEIDMQGIESGIPSPMQ